MMSDYDIIDVLLRLTNHLKKVQTVVAHHTNFDINVILSECYRIIDTYEESEINNRMRKLIKILNTKVKIECTMNQGKLLMKKSKNPKLTVLYEYLQNISDNALGGDFEQKHRALSDAKYCAKCYFYMKNNNLLA